MEEALLALAEDALVGADAATHALFAPAPDEVMLAPPRCPSYTLTPLEVPDGHKPETVGAMQSAGLWHTPCVR